MPKEPLFISKEGETIQSLSSNSGSLFHVHSEHLSIHCDEIIAPTKIQVDTLERLRDSSYHHSMEAMKQQGEGLRSLVEISAAPYLESYKAKQS